MKVTTNNPNKIINHASLQVSKSGLGLSLFINTAKKWDDSYGMQESGDDYIIFYFVNPDSPIDDSVTVWAETPEEEAMIKNHVFFSQDRDEIWYLFVKDDVYRWK